MNRGLTAESSKRLQIFYCAQCTMLFYKSKLAPAELGFLAVSVAVEKYTCRCLNSCYLKYALRLTYYHRMKLCQTYVY